MLPTRLPSLFYDGQCPLCRKEVTLLRRLSRGSLAFEDIHTSLPLSEAALRDSMLRVLHYRTREGLWLYGLDANVAAWSHTAWGWLFRPLRWPLMRATADRVYARWAARRYARRYKCGVCIAGKHL